MALVGDARVGKVKREKKTIAPIVNDVTNNIMQTNWVNKGIAGEDMVL